MQYPKLKGGSLCCEGIPYITVCDKAIGQGSAEAKRVAQCIRDVIQNNKVSLLFLPLITTFLA